MTPLDLQEWLIHPGKTLLAAFVAMMLCAGFQATSKTASGSNRATAIFFIIAVIMAFVSFGAGRSMDAGNAGAWGLGGLFGGVSALIWIAAAIVAWIAAVVDSRKRTREGDK